MTNEEAINVLEQIDVTQYKCKSTWFPQDMICAIEMAIKALEQQDVFDKIRAEILDEAEYAYADFDKYKEDILYAESDELPDDDFRYGMERAVEIIDKYKAESEDEG